MNCNQLWVVTIDGAASNAPDANAAVGILRAGLRQHIGSRPMRWGIERGGSVALVGTVFAASPEVEIEYDGWAAFWADSIRQQLGPAPGDAS